MIQSMPPLRSRDNLGGITIGQLSRDAYVLARVLDIHRSRTIQIVVKEISSAAVTFMTIE